MLRLAVDSEHACDPVARVVGKEVLMLFPNHLVDEFKNRMNKAGTACIHSYHEALLTMFSSPFRLDLKI